MDLDRETIGGYKLRSRITTGGMAEVFIASSPAGGADRLIVIKRARPELCQTREARAMMVDEARIGLQLRHPNIVATLDTGLDGGLPFVALEYVEGVDLRRLESSCWRDQSPMPVDVVGYVGRELLVALDHAHRACGDRGAPLGVVHRDVSPDNVLVSVDGAVKLSDFGIAVARDRTHRTRDGTAKGKLAYMAPEQLRGERVDPRTDLFALAATLYEALCGKPPFAGDGELDAISRLERGEFEPIRQRRPDVPPALAAIIESALARDREARPASAREMIAVFDRLAVDRAAAMRALAQSVHRAVAREPSRRAAADALERVLLGETDTLDDAAATAQATERVVARRSPGPVTAARVRTRRRFGLGIGLAMFVMGLAAAWFALTPGSSPPAVESRAAPTAEPATAPRPRRVDVPAPATPRAHAPGEAVVTAAEVATSGTPSAVDAPAPPSVDAPAPPSPAPAPRPHAPAARAARAGTVNVTSIPWARVSIDGRYVGDTPVRVRLAPGSHRVRLHNPHLERTRTTTVVIKEGRAATIKMEL